MKNSLWIVTPLLFAVTLYAEEPSGTVETDSPFEGWSSNVQIEERIFSDETSQTLLKFQTVKSLTEKISFFGGVWFRDQLPVYAAKSHPHLAGESDYVNYIDLYGGLWYDLSRYFNPYFFIEAYYDKPDPSDQWGTFGAIGFDGTLYSEGRHDISYYTERYYTIDTYQLESGKYWASESAVKYKYKIYKKTTLYLQAVWNTDLDEEGYGVSSYSEGIYSSRFGIQVDF